MTDPAPIDVHARAADDLHRMVLDLLPPNLFDLTDIDAARTNLETLLSAMPAPELPDGLSIDVLTIPGLDDDPDLEVRVYRPADLGRDAPALLSIHGGGMVLLDAASDDANCARRAVAVGCVVVSVDYRLAPEAPGTGGRCATATRRCRGSPTTPTTWASIRHALRSAGRAPEAASLPGWR